MQTESFCSDREFSVRTVLFDVGGTLIVPRHSVGEIYAGHAANFDFTADPVRLQQNFLRLFPLQERLAFSPDLSTAELLAREKDWWRRLVKKVFAAEGNFARFDQFFDEIYHGFERREFWQVIDGVAPTLATLVERGFTLGIVSNFDSRLFTILRQCQLDGFFSAVLISSQSGVAKPDPRLFELALEALNAAPSRTVHVGDSWREDVEGARAAGIHSILLDRDNRFNENLSGDPASAPPGPRGRKGFDRIVEFAELTEIDYLRGVR